MNNKTRFIIVNIICCFLIITTNSKAQISLDLSTANAFSLHEISPADINLANLNTFSTKINYVPKKIGLGVQFSISQFATDNNFLNQFTLSSVTLNASREEWTTSFISAGPVFKIGKNKLNLELFPKIGLGLIKSPDRQLIYNVGAEEYILYEDNQAESLGSTEFFTGLDAKINFQISKSIGIHLTSGINTNQFFGSGNSTIYRDVNPSGDVVTEEDIINSPLLQRNCNAFHLLNVGAGLSIGFPKKGKTNTKSPIVETAKNCLPTRLQNPNNNESYVLEDDRRPQFSWINYDGNVKHYLFALTQNSRTVYTKKVKEQTLQHNNDLEKIYQKSDGKESRYSWKVTTVYKDCPTKISTTRRFVIRDGGGSYIDVFDIVCDDPAYDENGNVRYTAKVTLHNDVRSIVPWEINDVTINPGGTIIPAASLTSCGSPSFSPATPYQIPPGATNTWCISFSVPFGTNTISSTANGTMGGGTSTVTDPIDSLPPCVCNTCDSWQFVGTLKNMQKPNLPGRPLNFQLANNIQILGSQPIMDVKAEIVSVQHEVNDTLCYTCTKQENKMGLMSFGTLKPRLLSPANSWQNGMNGTKGKDFNNDDYSNQVKWTATNPSIGVDFANRSHRFVIPINLPEPSTLDCCDSKYNVCVRYTFTDIDCNTCDTLICFDYDTANPPGGGGIGTGPGGLGNQQGSGTTLPLNNRSRQSNSPQNRKNDSINNDRKEANNLPDNMQDEISPEKLGLSKKDKKNLDKTDPIDDNPNEPIEGFKHAHCAVCDIEVTGDNISGVVQVCRKNPHRTRINVRDVISGQTWEDVQLYNGSPTVNDLPHGRTYHVSVKSKFSGIDPNWTSECGWDVSIDDDVTGTINIMNNQTEFCQDEEVKIQTNVQHDESYTITVYRNNGRLKYLLMNIPLASTENLNKLMNNGQPGYVFQPGDYQVDIMTQNDVGSKKWTLNFKVLPYTYKANLAYAEQNIESLPMGSVLVTSICSSTINYGPSVVIKRNEMTCPKNDLDVSIYKVDVNLGTQVLIGQANIDVTGLRVFKIKDFFPSVQFLPNEYYTITGAYTNYNGMLKMLPVNVGPCSLSTQQNQNQGSNN